MEIDEKIFQKVGWRPFDKQEEVLNCKNKEVLVCAGRGFGKSMMVAYIIFRELAQAIKSEKSFKCFVVAPTYNLTEKVFEHFLSAFLLKYNKQLGKFVSGGGNRPYQFKMSNDVWIQCKTTSEAVGMLGERVDLLIVDEAAQVPDKIYFQFLRPVISSKERKGLAYYIGTPRSKNWFENKFHSLGKSAFRFKSSEGLNYTPEMLEEERKQWPEMLFRQEFEAEFVSEAGRVFRNVDKVVSNTLRDSTLNHHYTMGVDLAEVEDWTVITVADSITKDIVYIDRFQKDYPVQKKMIEAVAGRYNNARVIIDATGVGKPIYEDLRESGLFVEDYVFSGKSKTELIGKLIIFIEQGYIKIPNHEDLIAELKAYEYKYLNEKTGEPLKTIQYGAPSGMHDDLVTSLALAVWGLDSNKPEPVNILKQRLQEKGNPNRESFI
jgi:hypothetical protein